MINMQKLEELPGKRFEFESNTWGNFSNAMKIVDDTLILKEWAKVMLTTNDPKARRVNGSIGTLIAIDPKKETLEIQIGSQIHKIA